ncbi:DUF742 domain-containing protein [Amycolatopsis nigrescens]|uniref:DUF742 domain-containing protein n=1 Tax=Amycolatopsis nigrescens TaxID=381445 RepID=UPI00036533B5|nr:DUF742 domain-containing protein [Amycolatopsis nigrescens]
MDAGRARGDGRLGDDDAAGARWPSHSDNAADGEDWAAFRDRVDREWRSRRSSGEQRAEAAEGSWLGSDPGEIPGPAEYSVEDFRDRLLSGPGAELFGGRRTEYPETPRDFTAFGGSPPDTGDLPSVPGLPVQSADEPEEGSGLVRPYFRTKGRTRPSYDLAIEALISTSERGRVLDRVRVPEHRSICDLCLDTRSVAEVAAYLRLPLGVVRVLIGDVAGLGLVLVHSASSAVGDRPSIEFMERVLSGLRRI